MRRRTRRLGAWLDALPSAGVRYLERLEDVPLEQVDVLWLRDAVSHAERLQHWLDAGGRLLATHEATAVVAAFDLESAPPATVPLPDPLPSDFGLAAFGAHPLFAGLRDGALLASPRGGLTARCYTHWPNAAVVAVERRGFALDPGRVLAWEYTVGAGGLLCIGIDPWPVAGAARDGEFLLANALVGDAIPHRDRLSTRDALAEAGPTRRPRRSRTTMHLQRCSPPSRMMPGRAAPFPRSIAHLRPSGCTPAVDRSFGHEPPGSERYGRPRSACCTAPLSRVRSRARRDRSRPMR